jgi:peroxiredoxin
MLRNSLVLKIIGLGVCLIIIPVVASGVKYSYSLLNYHFFESHEFPVETTGPKIGETISLNYLKDKTGRTVSESKNGKILLLGIVDPDCGACKLAKDQITWVQEGVQSKNVEYILVSFTSTNSEKFFKYTDSFGFPTNAFLWSDFNNTQSDSLQAIVVPSHILIDSSGRILKRFPGTNAERYVRRNMASQIIKEVLEEKDKIETY